MLLSCLCITAASSVIATLTGPSVFFTYLLFLLLQFTFFSLQTQTYVRSNCKLHNALLTPAPTQNSLTAFPNEISAVLLWTTLHTNWHFSYFLLGYNDFHNLSLWVNGLLKSLIWWVTMKTLPLAKQSRITFGCTVVETRKLWCSVIEIPLIVLK